MSLEPLAGITALLPMYILKASPSIFKQEDPCLLMKRGAGEGGPWGQARSYGEQRELSRGRSPAHEEQGASRTKSLLPGGS